MDKPKGGRGKKAPYETTHIRIPIPLKSKIEKLIQEYRLSLDDSLDSQDKKE